MIKIISRLRAACKRRSLLRAARQHHETARAYRSQQWHMLAREQERQAYECVRKAEATRP